MTLVLGKISPLGSVQRLPRRTRDLRRQLRRGRRRQMLSKLRVHPPTFGDPRIGILAGTVHQQHELAFSLVGVGDNARSEEHTSELQSLMRISYAVFCLKKKKTTNYSK